MNAYIIGAGYVGMHLAYNFNKYTNNYNLAGFFDDDKNGVVCCGLQVIGSIESALYLENSAVIIGITNPEEKKEIAEILQQNDTLRFPELIHEKSWVSPVVSIGAGTIVYPGTCINFGCVVRNFCVIDMNCSIGHHTRIGNYSCLEQGVSIGNNTEIGESVHIGIGATIIHNNTITDGAVIRSGNEPNLNISDLSGGILNPNVA